MVTAYQIIKRNKLKISIAAIIFAIASTTAISIKFDDEFENTNLGRTFFLLYLSQGYLTPEQASNPKSTNILSGYESNSLELFIQSTERSLEKDDEGNIIPPESLIKPTEEIRTLTIAEGEEMSSPYSYYFDSSYKYSSPHKQRTLTYIPLASDDFKIDRRLPEYICVGGAMKKKYDEQKPTSKQECINEAIEKSKKDQIALVKKQRENINYLNELLQKKKQQQAEIAEIENKMKSTPPIFAVNKYGACLAFKNIYRDLYIEQVGAFDTYDQCYSSTSSFRNHIWWNENREYFAIPLACIALLLAGLVAITFIMSAFFEGASAASAATINFISKASSAMNQEKKISVDAKVTLRKEDDNNK